MSKVQIDIGANPTGAIQGINKVSSSITNMHKHVGGVSRTMSAMFGGILGGAGIVAGIKAVQSMSGAFGDMIMKAAGFETLSIQLEVLTGSAATASKLLKEITDFGATTPLEQGDLQQSTKTLLAFGIEAENVMGILKMLGDVSMGNGAKLQSLALVYGKITAAGRLMGDDVNQLIDAGFNPLVTISKNLGLSMSETKKEMEKGNISIGMVEQSFKQATGEGGKFHDMLTRISTTTEGKLSNTVDSIDAVKKSFGEGFNNSLRNILDKINEMIPKLLEIANVIGTKIGSAANMLFDTSVKRIGTIFDLLKELWTAFNNGNLGGALWQGFMAGIKTAGNYLISIFKYASQEIGNAIRGILNDIVLPGGKKLFINTNANKDYEYNQKLITQWYKDQNDWLLQSAPLYQKVGRPNRINTLQRAGIDILSMSGKAQALAVAKSNYEKGNALETANRHLSFEQIYSNVLNNDMFGLKDTIARYNNLVNPLQPFKPATEEEKRLSKLQQDKTILTEKEIERMKNSAKEPNGKSRVDKLIESMSNVDIPEDVRDYTKKEYSLTGTIFNGLQVAADELADVAKNKINPFILGASEPLISSLQRVGGASIFADGGYLTEAQKQSGFLNRIERNTRKLRPAWA